MSDDLVAWLKRQLDDDERVAREASEPPWVVERASVMHSGPSASRHPDGQRLGRTVVASVGAWDLGVPTAADAEHIARWDPARVLAEIEAKRRILDDYAILVGAIRRVDDVDGNRLLYARREARESDIRWLAQPYTDRPGWREEWRV
jgi:hypothetical protein